MVGHREQRRLRIGAVLDTVHPGCAGETEHPLAELQPERHLRERAVAVADRNETEGRARDQRVPSYRGYDSLRLLL